MARPLHVLIVLEVRCLLLIHFQVLALEWSTRQRCNKRPKFEPIQNVLQAEKERCQVPEQKSKKIVCMRLMALLAMHWLSPITQNYRKIFQTHDRNFDTCIGQHCLTLFHHFYSNEFSLCLTCTRSENEPFSTAERSERVENFLFRAMREYTEAGIEQAIVSMRRLGANSPEPRKRAVREWHVNTQKTGSYITERSRLHGLIVGPCPSEESLCCPACFSENRTSSACSRTCLLQVNWALRRFLLVSRFVLLQVMRDFALSSLFVGLLAPSDRSYCAVQLVFSPSGCPFPLLVEPLWDCLG